MKTILLLCGLSITQASASVITYLNSPATPIDTVSWGQLGPDGTPIASTFNATSALGVAVAGALGGTDGLVSVVCAPGNPANCSWTPQPGTGYSTGDSLIWAEDSTNAGSGPITLSFAAQYGVGAYLQATAAGPFGARLDLYNGASIIGTNSWNSDANGDPLFIGAIDDTRQITKAVFSVTSCGSFACDPTDMSMDTLQIYGAPEPATFWLTGTLAVLGFVGIRKQKRNRA